MKIKHYLLISIFVSSFQFSLAQSEASSDELFQQARSLAFDQKDYVKAIALSKAALTKSPDYADIRIFLGRLYTWSDKPDSARMELKAVLAANPGHEDATLALGSLEYWEDKPEEGMNIVDAGLKAHPDSKDLRLLRVKILSDLKRWELANAEVEGLIKADPNFTEARSLSARIRENSSRNKLGVNYDFIYFDKQFENPWHLVSAEYGRQTDLGSITGRINYANRFSTNGVQFEVDAYPRISNTFQAYISGAYSNDVGVFPEYRAGFSLYANLPASFEAEAGFRYLTFGNDTWIYTAAIGKYYKSFWFNFRTYLTPSNEAISRSFGLTARYYYGGADDYFSLRLGTGISPDDPQNSVLLGSTGYKLISNNATLTYRRLVKSLNILTLTLGIDNQEYLRDTRGNQIDLGIGYMRRF